MASATVSKAPSNSTDVYFRLWGKAMSDQIATSWTLVTDSGDLDWTTITAPAGINTSQGYEIWKSNDAGGGLSDIYFKIEYGSGANATTPSLWVTVGFASDGAGTITGIKTARTQVQLAGGGSTVALDCHLGVGTGWLSIFMFCAVSSTYGGFFSIERARDDSGNQTNEVAFCYAVYGNNLFSILVTPTTLYGIPTITGQAQGIANPIYSTFGTTVGLSFQMAQRVGLTNPLINLFGCGLTQFGAVGNIVSVTSYGVSHNYIVNQFTGSVNCYFFSALGVYILSRYE